VPNQFAVGKNQIIHKNAADDFFMQGLMVAPNTGGRCAGVREPFPKATESQTIS